MSSMSSDNPYSDDNFEHYIWEYTKRAESCKARAAKFLKTGLQYRVDQSVILYRAADRNLRLVAKLEEAVELQDQVADWEEGSRKVLEDKCPTDEHHCCCVGVLKARIAELEALVPKKCVHDWAYISHRERFLCKLCSASKPNPMRQTND